MKQEPIITLQDVDKTYVTLDGETVAVQGISFTVYKGEFVTLLGPSGCGKTTILSLLAGLITPTNGKLLINGSPLHDASRRIGYMLQQDYLLDWRTIKQNAMFGLEIRKQKDEEHTNSTLQLLEEMGLQSFADYYPHQLSGGMRQRVALVRTLATNPEILLLDEPFSALDYMTKLRLEDLVIRTLRKHGKTAVLVTHDISEAIAMSDRIIILSAQPGRIQRIMGIPPALRDPFPLASRDMPEFQDYFLRVWRELNVQDEKRANDEQKRDK